MPSSAPWGDWPYDDVEISSDFMTPWETTLEQDIAQLVGSYRGTLVWRDGEEVITVPKAGEELEVEAVVEVDPTTAKMRVYESTEETPVCDTDYLFLEATVTFVRVDDGEVELTTSATVERTVESSVYQSDEVTPVSESIPGLAPLQDSESEGVSMSMWWGGMGEFRAEYSYVGQSSGSTSGTAWPRRSWSFPRRSEGEIPRP